MTIMKCDLFGLKLLRPLNCLFEELELDKELDKDNLANNLVDACGAIYEYVCNDRYTFESPATTYLAIRLLQHNLGIELYEMCDLELLLEMFKAKYQMNNIVFKRENPKLKDAN